MPRRSYRRKRRTFKRKRKSYSVRNFRKAKNSFGIPSQLNTKLVYDSGYALLDNTSVATGSNIIVFSANSIFNPDVNAKGSNNGQPRYRDELAFLWGRYRVNAVLIECWFGMSTANTAMVNIMPIQSGAAAQDKLQDYLEFHQGKTRIIKQTQPLYMKNFYKINAIESVKSSVIKTDESYSAGQGVDPDKQCFVVAAMNNIINDTDVTTVRCRCRITYYTTMYQPILVPSS